jgi:type IV secretory pathway TrbL component
MKNIKIMLVSALFLTQVASIYTAEGTTMTSESKSMQSKKRKNSNDSAIIKDADHEGQQNQAEHHIAGKQETNRHTQTKKKSKRSNSTRKSNSTSPHNNKGHKKEETR